MIDHQCSCAVSSLTKCNHATIPFNNATQEATNNATNDLLALSERVIKRNKHNQTSNSSETGRLNSNATHRIDDTRLQQRATNQTGMVDAFSQESCAVAFRKGDNHATQELKRLIKLVSDNYGGDDPEFLATYMEDIIRDWSHDLNRVTKIFAEAATTKPPIINRGKQEVV